MKIVTAFVKMLTAKAIPRRSHHAAHLNKTNFGPLRAKPVSGRFYHAAYPKTARFVMLKYSTAFSLGLLTGVGTLSAASVITEISPLIPTAQILKRNVYTTPQVEDGESPNSAPGEYTVELRPGLTSAQVDTVERAFNKILFGHAGKNFKPADVFRRWACWTQDLPDWIMIHVSCDEKRVLAKVRKLGGVQRVDPTQILQLDMQKGAEAS